MSSNHIYPVVPLTHHSPPLFPPNSSIYKPTQSSPLSQFDSSSPSAPAESALSPAPVPHSPVLGGHPAISPGSAPLYPSIANILSPQSHSSSPESPSSSSNRRRSSASSTLAHMATYSPSSDHSSSNVSHSSAINSQSTAVPYQRPQHAMRPIPQEASRTEGKFPCQWNTCSLVWDEPEDLYNHLCNDHIGRKSTQNLCLTCHWKDCGIECAKRDHITSHLRVHTPLKPHGCPDLKKHERIHTSEHHEIHRHSKAHVADDSDLNGGKSNRGLPSKEAIRTVTSTQSKIAANLKARSGSNDSGSTQTTNDDRYGRSTSSPTNSSRSPLSNGQDPLTPPQIPSAGLYDGILGSNPALLAAAFGSHGLPDASNAFGGGLGVHNVGSVYPSFNGSWDSQFHQYQQQQHQQESRKRSNQFDIENFLDEVKKRKIEPSYNDDMAQRLEAMTRLAASYQMPPPAQMYNRPLHSGLQGVLPTPYFDLYAKSAPFLGIPEIKNEYDLAQINAFLVTLGKEAAAAQAQAAVAAHAQAQAQLHASMSMAAMTGGYSSQNGAGMFDAATLASLGLAGMPGLDVDVNNTGYNNNYGTNNNGVPPLHFPNLYPPSPFLQPNAQPAEVPIAKRPIAQLPTSKASPPVSNPPPRPGSQTLLPFGGHSPSAFTDHLSDHSSAHTPPGDYLSGLENNVSSGGSPHGSYGSVHSPPSVQLDQHQQPQYPSFDSLAPSRGMSIHPMLASQEQHHLLGNHRSFRLMETLSSSRSTIVDPPTSNERGGGSEEAATPVVAPAASHIDTDGGESEIEDEEEDDDEVPHAMEVDPATTLSAVEDDDVESSPEILPSMKLAPSGVDSDLKLPSISHLLNRSHRSSSSSSTTPSTPPVDARQTSSSASSSRSSSPAPMLPHLTSLYPSLLPPSMIQKHHSDMDEMTGRVGRVEISSSTGPSASDNGPMSHAQFIQGLLVMVNQKFKQFKKETDMRVAV